MSFGDRGGGGFSITLRTSVYSHSFKSDSISFVPGFAAKVLARRKVAILRVFGLIPRVYLPMPVGRYAHQVLPSFDLLAGKAVFGCRRFFDNVVDIISRLGVLCVSLQLVEEFWLLLVCDDAVTGMFKYPVRDFRAFPNHVYELGRHTQGRSGVQISCYLSACLVALPCPRRWLLRNLRELAWVIADEDEIVVKLISPLAAAGISRWHTWLVGPKASLAKQVLNSRCFQKQRGGYDVLEQTRPAIYLPIWLHAGHLHNSLWTALCGALAGRGQMQVRCFKRGSGGDELR